MVPIIGLTATATEKVQEDILKTLGMATANTFKASFNRPNLFYDVRSKTKNINEIESKKKKNNHIYQNIFSKNQVIYQKKNNHKKQN